MITQKQITLLVNNPSGSDITIELFHALANRCESYAASQYLNNQPAFFTDGTPMLTAEGILKIMNPPLLGMQYWLSETMYGVDNTGTKEWNIQGASGLKYGYRNILKYLQARKIKVGKVTIQGSPTSIRNTWKLRRYFLDNTQFEEDIFVGNNISPEQVNNNIVVFDLNRVIDGDTAIEVHLLAGTFISIIFDFTELN